MTSEPFCFAPWVNIHINNSLQIKPCCAWPESFQSIENYTSGKDLKLIELKNQLASNQPPKPCVGCVERNWYSEFKTSELNEFSIESVDVRWSSTCQLNCMYCNHNWSSSWGQLVSRKTVIPIASNRIKDVENVFDLFSKSKIKRVSMLGGEPLLIKENIRLLDIISEDTGVEIFTNLNVNLDSNKIYQQLIERTNVNWYVSMENVGNKFEFVRRNANWNKQVKNLEQLLQTQPKSVSLQAQYCVYNAFDLIDLYEFASGFNNLHVNLIGNNFNPKVLDIFSYPPNVKLTALAEIDRCLIQYPKSAHVLTPIKEKLVNDMDIVIPNIAEECVKWHRDLESKFFNNRFNFVDLWPQFDKTNV
jgi:MoaA/NifB/PqqE/SkfB family radical SAM enzyme